MTTSHVRSTRVEQSRAVLRYALPYRRRWVFAGGTMLLGTAVTLLQPWPMKIVMDHVLGGRPPSERWKGLWLLPGADSTIGLLAWMVFATLGLFALNSAVHAFLTLSWTVTGRQVVYDLAADLFAKLQHRSVLLHRRYSVGDLLSRLVGDSWCVYKLLEHVFFAPAHALITTLAMVVVMARMNLELTFLSVALAPFIAATCVLLGKPIRGAARMRRNIESRLHTQVHQTLTGIPVVQAFTQEQRERQRFEALADKAIQAQRRVTLVEGLYALGPGLITTFGMILLLWVGTHAVLDGELTLGSLLVFLAYLESLQTQIRHLTTTYSTLLATSAEVDRIMAVWQGKNELACRPRARRLRHARGHVRIERVTFGYEPGQPVLRAVSAEAVPGQTVALVGPSGAGKSTLLGLVPRFFDPWSGRIRIDHHDVRDLQLESLRSQVAVVLQEPLLLSGTVAENVAYGRPGATEREIEDAACAANAHGFIESLPQGYETLIGLGGATLSGGERQRLAIARALLRDAPILILDEPTHALDTETEQLILEALQRLINGRTTLIITHRLSTIRAADKILVIYQGRLVQEGTHEELLRSPGHYQNLYTAQFRDTQPVLRTALGS